MSAWIKPGTPIIYNGQLGWCRADYGADSYIELEDGRRKFVIKLALSKPHYCLIGEHWALPPAENDYMCPSCREALDSPSH